MSATTKLTRCRFKVPHGSGACNAPAEGVHGFDQGRALRVLVPYCAAHGAAQFLAEPFRFFHCKSYPKDAA